jgi:hypothetical protein
MTRHVRHKFEDCKRIDNKCNKKNILEIHLKSNKRYNFARFYNYILIF